MIAPVIAIYGPEGAGKSTTVAALQHYLQSQGHKAKVVFLGRGKDNIIPINKLGKRYNDYKEKRGKEEKYKGEKYKGEKYKGEKCKENRYKEREIGRRPSSKNAPSLPIKALYISISLAFTVDLLLRYAVQVLPSRIKGITVVCDRYSSDLYLMEKVPLAVRKFLLHLFPKPARTFYLYNTIEVLQQRKGRGPEDLLWQREQFPVINKRYAAIAIKTDSKEDTLRQIIENIKPFLPSTTPPP